MTRTRYDEDPTANYTPQGDGIFRPSSAGAGSADETENGGAGDDEKPLSVSELLYSSSSYYAIAKPGKELVFHGTFCLLLVF